MEQQQSWDSSDPLKPNPEAFKQKDNNGRVEHQQIAEDDQLKDSGKDIGLIHSPIVSLHPTSSKNAGDQPDEYEVFDNANRYLNHDGPRYDFAYPFPDMKVGQGFFVPVQNGSTVDKLIAHMNKAVDAFHKQTAVQEHDENGDDVLESVTTLPKKRTPDGIIQLDSLGKPIVGANHTNRPKLIRIAHFVIKSAVKGDELAEGRKAESDGALVIRVA